MLSEMPFLAKTVKFRGLSSGLTTQQNKRLSWECNSFSNWRQDRTAHSDLTILNWCRNMRKYFRSAVLSNAVSVSAVSFCLSSNLISERTFLSVTIETANVGYQHEEQHHTGALLVTKFFIVARRQNRFLFVKVVGLSRSFLGSAVHSGVDEIAIRGYRSRYTLRRFWWMFSQARSKVECWKRGVTIKIRCIRNIFKKFRNKLFSTNLISMRR